MNILNATLVCLFMGVMNNPEAESKAFSYIEAHKELAIIEMYRSGIPASITLAQAIHESQSGCSELARNANNHFGIKCKSYWEGGKYYHEDDDYDRQGKLIESCFRSYSSVFDSYVDHSNFLRHTRHYKKLFTIPREDYKSWAIGLQKCGYATDPNYARKLIKIVEKYNLTSLDKADDPFQRLKTLD